MTSQSRRSLLRNGLLTIGAMAVRPSSLLPHDRLQAALAVAYIDFAYVNPVSSPNTKAITIRRNFRTPLPAHSWEKGREATLEPSRAAYSIADTRDKTIVIRVSFRLTDRNLEGQSIHVRAVEPEGTHNKNVLGSVAQAEVKVSYEAANEMSLPLKDVRLNNAGVGKSKIVWQWQYKPVTSQNWVDIERTEHTIYTLLNAPKQPWRLSDTPHDVHESQRPWTDVLDYACLWANGAKTPEEAATLITESLHALGKKPVVFQGVPSYVRYDRQGFYTGLSDEFFCSNFLDLLAGAPTLPPHLNCVDCASVVTTFANALGCELSLMQIERASRTASDFELNQILPMGFESPKVPYPIDSFSYHVVAWSGPWQAGAAANGGVYDAIAKVDGDSDPTDNQHDWKLPTNMPFGEQMETPARLGYLHRFVAPGSRGNCIPTAPLNITLDAPQPPFQAQLFPSERSIRADRLELMGLQEPVDTTSAPIIKDYSPTGAEARGWHLLSRRGRDKLTKPTFRVGSVNRLDAYWAPVNNTRHVLAEISSYECSTRSQAHLMLSQVLQGFEASLRPLRGRLILGDIAFAYADGLSIVFRRANLVVRLANVGATALPLMQLARSLDRDISGRLKL